MVNHLPPQLPAHAMKTYSIKAPIETHWRDGTCAEADCPNHLHGWVTKVDESSELGQQQAHYIRHDRTRRHHETRDDTGLTVFTFAAGQTCFQKHKVSLERPELYVVRGGDWRGNPLGDVQQHTSADSWLDDFATHQDRLDRHING